MVLLSVTVSGSPANFSALNRIRSLRLIRRQYATFSGYVAAQTGLTAQQYSELCRAQLMAEALLDPDPSIEESPLLGRPKSAEPAPYGRRTGLAAPV